jgi:hypothetical protein
MLKLIATYTLPEWALPALINGDITGLSGTEEDQLDQFVMEFNEFEGLIFDALESESFFSCCPEFGLACQCYTVDVWGHVKEGVINA